MHRKKEHDPCFSLAGSYVPLCFCVSCLLRTLRVRKHNTQYLFERFEVYGRIVALQHKLEEHAPYNLWDCARTAMADGDSTAVDIIEVAKIPDEGLLHLGLPTSSEHEFQG